MSSPCVKIAKYPLKIGFIGEIFVKFNKNNSYCVFLLVPPISVSNNQWTTSYHSILVVSIWTHFFSHFKQYKYRIIDMDIRI